jgi:hypothetical protein
MSDLDTLALTFRNDYVSTAQLAVSSNFTNPGKQYAQSCGLGLLLESNGADEANRTADLLITIQLREN